MDFSVTSPTFLGERLRIGTSNKFPGAAAGAGLETVLREQLVYAKRGSQQHLSREGAATVPNDSLPLSTHTSPNAEAQKRLQHKDNPLLMNASV